MEQAFENALRYISDILMQDPHIPLSDIIDKASQKFDLTPIQSENLLRMYLERKANGVK